MRSSKYKEEFCKNIIDYFNVPYTKINKVTKREVANDMPLIGDFCRIIGVPRVLLMDWVKKKPKFKEAYDTAKDLQKNLWIQNSLNSRYNTAFTIFMGKNMFGWKDKQEMINTHSGKIEINNNNKELKKIASKYEKELYDKLKQKNEFRRYFNPCLD